MRIVCSGGGPAGLYFAISAKLRNPAHEITVVERNPVGTTFGWGVVFWDDLLDSLFRNDANSARAISAGSVVWDGQQVRVQGRRPAYIGGCGYGIGRWRLLDILTRRARQLGVDLRFAHEYDPSEFADADLVVASDGVRSGLREGASAQFGPRVVPGRNKYIWLGTRKAFTAFTFAFQRTPAGWIWCHSYAYDSDASTFIAECSPETWAGLGFDRLGPADTTRALEQIFADHLDGQPLLVQPAEPAAGAADRPESATPWLSFTEVSNAAWSNGSTVLVGDAAHTTHFSIGSGTRLAVEDAICLADCLATYDDLEVALKAYENERRSVVQGWQEEAAASARWFETLDARMDKPAVQLAYALLGRRGGPGADDAAAPSLTDWRYLNHLATQNRVLRGLRKTAVTGPRRRRRARRREQALTD